MSEAFVDNDREPLPRKVVKMNWFPTSWEHVRDGYGATVTYCPNKTHHGIPFYTWEAYGMGGVGLDLRDNDAVSTLNAAKAAALAAIEKHKAGS